MRATPIAPSKLNVVFADKSTLDGNATGRRQAVRCRSLKPHVFRLRSAPALPKPQTGTHRPTHLRATRIIHIDNGALTGFPSLSQRRKHRNCIEVLFHRPMKVEVILRQLRVAASYSSGRPVHG